MRLSWQAVTSDEAARSWVRPPSVRHAVPLGTNLRTGRPVFLDPLSLDRAGILPDRRVLVSGSSAELLRRWIIGTCALGAVPVVAGDTGDLAGTVTGLGGQVVTIGREAGILNPLDVAEHREAVLVTLLTAACQQPLSRSERALLRQALATLDTPDPLLWNVHASLDRVRGAQRLTNTLGSVIHHYADILDRPTSFTLDQTAPAVCLTLSAEHERDPLLRAVLTAASWSLSSRVAREAAVMPIHCGVSALAATSALQPAGRLVSDQRCSTLVVDSVADMPSGWLTPDMRVHADGSQLTIAIAGAPRVVVSLQVTPTEQALARGDVPLPTAVAEGAGQSDPPPRDAPAPVDAGAVDPVPPLMPDEVPLEQPGVIGGRTPAGVAPAAAPAPEQVPIAQPQQATTGVDPSGRRHTRTLVAAGLAAAAVIGGRVIITGNSPTSQAPPSAQDTPPSAGSTTAVQAPVQVDGLLAAGAALPVDAAGLLAAGAPLVPILGGSVFSASTVPAPGPPLGARIVAATGADPIALGGSGVTAGAAPTDRPRSGGRIIAAAAKPRRSPVLRDAAVAWTAAASWQQSREYIAVIANSPAGTQTPWVTSQEPPAAQPAAPAPAPAQSSADTSPAGGSAPVPGAPAPNQPFNPQNPDSMP